MENQNEKTECDIEGGRAVDARNGEKAQNYNRKYFDKSRKEAYKYKEDYYVMVKNFESTPGVSKKLIPKYKGPYRVIKVLRNDRYVLGDVENFQKVSDLITVFKKLLTCDPGVRTKFFFH